MYLLECKHFGFLCCGWILMFKVLLFRIENKINYI